MPNGRPVRGNSRGLFCAGRGSCVCVSLSLPQQNWSAACVGQQFGIECYMHVLREGRNLRIRPSR
eukprot:2931237-Prymnesium_polylepis.1